MAQGQDSRGLRRRVLRRKTEFPGHFQDSDLTKAPSSYLPSPGLGFVKVTLSLSPKDPRSTLGSKILFSSSRQPFPQPHSFIQQTYSSFHSLGASISIWCPEEGDQVWLTHTNVQSPDRQRSHGRHICTAFTGVYDPITGALSGRLSALHALLISFPLFLNPQSC